MFFAQAKNIFDVLAQVNCTSFGATRWSALAYRRAEERYLDVPEWEKPTFCEFFITVVKAIFFGHLEAVISPVAEAFLPVWRFLGLGDATWQTSRPKKTHKEKF